MPFARPTEYFYTTGVRSRHYHMSDDLTIPETAPETEPQPVPTDLVAVPDDPDDPSEVTIQRKDATSTDLATEWIALDVDDLVDLHSLQ